MNSTQKIDVRAAAMLGLERVTVGDAGWIAGLEQAQDNRAFLLPYPEDEHARRIGDPRFVYLRIVHDGNRVGFFILVPEPETQSTEFRRLVVSDKGRGIGQAAIATMERFCVNELQSTRIWLDVFEHNTRGRHVYEKSGYVQFAEQRHEGGRLLLYQKRFAAVAATDVCGKMRPVGRASSGHFGLEREIMFGSVV